MAIVEGTLSVRARDEWSAKGIGERGKRVPCIGSPCASAHVDHGTFGRSQSLGSYCKIGGVTSWWSRCGFSPDGCAVGHGREHIWWNLHGDGARAVLELHKRPV